MDQSSIVLRDTLHVSRDTFEERYLRVNCVARISGGNVDVFDLAAGWRDWKAIFLEAFKMKLDGLTDEQFGFHYGGSGRDATW